MPDQSDIQDLQDKLARLIDRFQRKISPQLNPRDIQSVVAYVAQRHPHDINPVIYFQQSMAFYESLRNEAEAKGYDIKDIQAGIDTCSAILTTLDLLNQISDMKRYISYSNTLIQQRKNPYDADDEESSPEEDDMQIEEVDPDQLYFESMRL
jgi:hypothetical protein